MRYGGETGPTLEGIHQRVDYIRENHLLPPGMDIEPYYDRGELVQLTTHTVMENLLVGMLLVSIVLVLFLGNTRGALITAVNIPLALLVAFCGMVATGTPANLISLGAVDFGIVVDSTVIMVENIFRHLGSHGTGSMKERILVGRGRGRQAAGLLEAHHRRGVPAALHDDRRLGRHLRADGPHLRLRHRRRSRPRAHADAGARRAIRTASRPGDGECADAPAPPRSTTRLFDLALRHPQGAVILTAGPAGLLCVRLLLAARPRVHAEARGGQLLDPRDAADVDLARAVVAVRGPDASRSSGSTPKIETVVSQLGRPDDGTDVSGFYNIELFAPLKPFDEWPRGPDQGEADRAAVAGARRGLPGRRLQLLADDHRQRRRGGLGVKGENTVKVVGPDLQRTKNSRDSRADVLSKVRGIKDLGLFSSLGQPNVTITLDRPAGRPLRPQHRRRRDRDPGGDRRPGGDAGLRGREAVRPHGALAPQPYRRTVEAIRQITVATPDGYPDSARSDRKDRVVDGPSVIYREDGQRYAPVKFSVRGRDLPGAIGEAPPHIASQGEAPLRHSPRVGGGDQRAPRGGRAPARHHPDHARPHRVPRLQRGQDWLDTAVVLLNIPVACAGGLLALLVTGINFSVSAAMGFISIFGIAIQDAILMVTYAQPQWRKAVRRGRARRSPPSSASGPVLMTTLVAMLGLFPAAVSHGIGAQTQKPLAIVVIGGSFVLAVLTRVLQPPLLVLAHRWRERWRGQPAPAALPESA